MPTLATSLPSTLPADHHPTAEADVREHLAHREAHYGSEAERLDRRSRWLARARLVSVLAVLTSFVLAVNARAAGAPWWAALGAAAVLVGVLIVRHARVDDARRHAQACAEFHRHARARLDRRWREAPPPVASSPVTGTALDLDLVGPASLLHLIGAAATGAGQRRLESWTLSAQFDLDVIRERQEAVRELAPHVAFRESLAAAGRLAPDDASRVEAFLRWVTAPREPIVDRMRWVVTPLTAVLWLGFAGAAIGVASPWPAVLAIGWGLTLALSRRVRADFEGAGALSYGLGLQLSLVRLIEEQAVAAPLLARTRQVLVSPERASLVLGRLDRLVGFSQFRHGALLHVIVHSLTLWDLHVWLALDRWRARHAGTVRVWLDAVATYDALAQLAGLAHLHPEWPLPTFVTDPRLRATGLGHPLLPSAARVTNDVEVGPPGTVLVVTGSNMAGKSTMLRAIGLNAVLARMGAPVCAEAISLPPVRLETCMRTVDSLEEGVSSFMAQLRRLKAVVDAANETGPVLLYLLDEVLHGTNSEERRIAVQRIVAHLLRAHAIGALTTHDLELTRLAELSEAARHVHFSETVDETVAPPVMRFDYRMRPGPATSRNALKLVRMMGLPEV